MRAAYWFLIQSSLKRLGTCTDTTVALVSLSATSAAGSGLIHVLNC